MCRVKTARQRGKLIMTEATPSQDVLYTVANHIATITLNRPHRRNALNFPAYDRLEASFRKAAADTEVRCVVVTGTDPAFCSGDDVSEIMAGPNALSKRAEEPPAVRHRPTPA